jgi:hypothetical protein
MTGEFYSPTRTPFRISFVPKSRAINGFTAMANIAAIRNATMGEDYCKLFLETQATLFLIRYNLTIYCGLWWGKI